MTTAAEIIETMLDLRGDDRQVCVLARFFKTGPGEYGEGDKFLGIRCPQTRTVVRAARCDVSPDEVALLLRSEWHEVRLCGFLLIVEEMQAALPRRSRPDSAVLAERRKAWADFYLANARRANNWDLVDMSCPKILGHYLLHPGPDGRMPSRSVLDRLADSSCMWEQRIAMVTNWMLIRAGEYADTVRIADRLLHHPHDLMHKAVGWMLREMGKRSPEALTCYLEAHWHEMPRTALRYAIEKMPPDERRYWLQRRE